MDGICRLYQWDHWQKDSWTPPDTIHPGGDGDDGPDFSGTAEDLEFSDDSDGLDEAFAAMLPALELTRIAAIECAAAGGFGAGGDKAERAFVGLYVEAQTPAEVVRNTGARREFVEQMQDVAWLDSTLRQHCKQATIDAIVNAIIFRARH